jgi:hypothetical protein
MAIWIKTNGNEIEINDEPSNVKACEDMGWRRKEEKAERKKPSLKNKNKLN